MNTQDKSLKLAELMEWDVAYAMFGGELCTNHWGGNAEVKPYSQDRDGLAQFAAILLKFPEVMANLCAIDEDFMPVLYKKKLANQEFILNEILRMNGVEP